MIREVPCVKVEPIVPRRAKKEANWMCKTCERYSARITEKSKVTHDKNLLSKKALKVMRCERSRVSL